MQARVYDSRNKSGRKRPRCIQKQAPWHSDHSINPFYKLHLFCSVDIEHGNEVNIKIPRNCKNRLEFVKIALAKQAFKKFNNRIDQAKFIGIHDRTLRLWLNFYPELNDYKQDLPRLDGNEFWAQYEDDEAKWKTKKIKGIEDGDD